MKRFEHHRLSPTFPRRGTAMVFALIALLLTSLMIAGLLRTVSMSHRQLKREEFRLQASLLADAGCARAVARLRDQPDFTNETWKIAAGELSSDRSAVVELKVTTKMDARGERIVSATAEYPTGQPDVVRVTRTISLRTKNE